MSKYKTFKFKQFEIGQEKCAMKIGTDGMLLGAWADLSDCTTMLDIGTGSGLISLMCAQRYSELKIIGIDIDLGASEQAEENFKNSPWKERLSVKHIDFSELILDTKVDAVVSNPPFFKDSYKANTEERTKARHSDHLTLESLFSSSSKVLTKGGKLILIYPFDQVEDIYKIATQYSFHIAKHCEIAHNIKKPVKRVMLEFIYQNLATRNIVSKLYLKENNSNNFSEQYISITKDFHPFL
ncbi:tRNA1(Val) (adenine(37)-N6)-methyltransferase [Flammeovirga kamogawensis]|uniref:tRNA1(Val) (adenine(37)-N6)-methyltransferase n=1 Tax=Flammeovirga kamogawensis TaxID=373891 RepID=A0ABX8GVB6_9BACT|nr:methyltransferase [Flammeovirga kamogawensis]MBB6459775.1 tRNA1Val (adenine37-N6)-methyltransferase [Flammeovirga kamogawensis]QWG07167.1 methyltransferase [Flammeovirga kamogawensis]TRX68989.1 methyltransferase [Flammeovirga kamogawensis]